MSQLRGQSSGKLSVMNRADDLSAAQPNFAMILCDGGSTWATLTLFTFQIQVASLTELQVLL